LNKTKREIISSGDVNYRCWLQSARQVDRNWFCRPICSVENGSEE